MTQQKDLKQLSNEISQNIQNVKLQLSQLHPADQQFKKQQTFSNHHSQNTAFTEGDHRIQNQFVQNRKNNNNNLVSFKDRSLTPQRRLIHEHKYSFQNVDNMATSLQNSQNQYLTVTQPVQTTLVQPVQPIQPVLPFVTYSNVSPIYQSVNGHQICSTYLNPQRIVSTQTIPIQTKTYQECVTPITQVIEKTYQVEKPVYFETLIEQPIYQTEILEKQVYKENRTRVDQLQQELQFYQIQLEQQQKQSKIIEKSEEINKLDLQNENLVLQIQQLRQSIIQNQSKVVQKIVEVPKYIDNAFEVENNNQIRLLVQQLYELNQKPKTIVQRPKIRQEIIKKPKYVEKIIYQDRDKYIEDIQVKNVPKIEYVTKYIDVPKEKIVQKKKDIVQIQEVEKIIEKQIQVDKPVVKIIENIIERQVVEYIEVPNYIDKIIEVERPREVIEIVEIPKETIEYNYIQEVQEQIKYVDKIIEKEKIIEQIIQRPIKKQMEKIIEVKKDIIKENIIQKTLQPQIIYDYKYLEREVQVELPPVYINQSYDLEITKDRIVEIPYDNIMEEIVEVQVPQIQMVERINQIEKPVHIYKEVPVNNTIVKIVEIPKPYIEYQERPYELEKTIEIESIEYREIEKIVEVEVPRIQYIRNEIPIEKIVEKKVFQKVERSVFIENPIEIEKIIEVPEIQYIERPKEVEKIIRVPRIQIEYIEQIVEVPKYIKFERVITKEIDNIIEVPREYIVEKIVEVPIEEIVQKIIYKPKIEYIEKTIQVEDVTRINELQKEFDLLLNLVQKVKYIELVPTGLAQRVIGEEEVYKEERETQVSQKQTIKSQYLQQGVLGSELKKQLISDSIVYGQGGQEFVQFRNTYTPDRTNYLNEFGTLSNSQNKKYTVQPLVNEYEVNNKVSNNYQNNRIGSNKNLDNAYSSPQYINSNNHRQEFISQNQLHRVQNQPNPKVNSKQII